MVSLEIKVIGMVGFARSSVIQMFIYMFKQDRKLLTFAFEKSADKFVRKILEDHSQFLSTKILLDKLDKVTTDRVRKTILTKVFENTGSKPVVKWVNEKGGLSSLTKGLKDLMLYDLKIKPHEFSIETSVEGQSASVQNLLIDMKKISKKVNFAFSKMMKSIGKSDSVYNKSIREVFSTMQEFNEGYSKVSTLSERDKTFLNSSVLHFLESSKDFQVTNFKPITLIESILYLPKKHSVFYIAEYETISNFFTNLSACQGRGSWAYRIPMNENQFGNLILNSSAKLF